MNKILLVYEDYADLMAVEATLKKIGFDVIGLSNEYSIPEQMVAFNPDLVVGCGNGGKVSSLGVGKRLKETNRWQGKSLLIFSPNFKPNPADLIRIRVDMILESPVIPIRLVQVIGKMLGHDEATLIERLNKAQTEINQKQSGIGAKGSGKYSTEEEPIFVKGTIDTNRSSSNEEGYGTPEKMPFQIENNENEDDKPLKKIFNFNDPSDSELASKEDEDDAFLSVDLKALEQELMGGGAPVSVEDTSDVADEQVELLETQKKAQKDLENSEKDLKQRISKYSEMVADLKVSPKSSVTRVEAKRRLRRLKAELKDQNLSELDKLRQEFTKALFKK